MVNLLLDEMNLTTGILFMCESTKPRLVICLVN